MGAAASKALKKEVIAMADMTWRIAMLRKHGPRARGMWTPRIMSRSSAGGKASTQGRAAAPPRRRVSTLRRGSVNGDLSHCDDICRPRPIIQTTWSNRVPPSSRHMLTLLRSSGSEQSGTMFLLGSSL